MWVTERDTSLALTEQEAHRPVPAATQRDDRFHPTLAVDTTRTRNKCGFVLKSYKHTRAGSYKYLLHITQRHLCHVSTVHVTSVFTGVWDPYIPKVQNLGHLANQKCMIAKKLLLMPDVAKDQTDHSASPGEWLSE